VFFELFSETIQFFKPKEASSMFFDPAIIATLKLKEAAPKPLEDGDNNGDLRPLQEEKRVTRHITQHKPLIFQRFRGSKKAHQ
jgi:hypothetical protein